MNIYNKLMPIMRFPIAIVSGAWVVRSVYFMFDKNESGASATNHTRIRIRAADPKNPAVFDTLADWTTENNPKAGFFHEADVEYHLTRGWVIYPWITVAGTGGVNFNGEGVLAGCEILEVPL